MSRNINKALAKLSLEGLESRQLMTADVLVIDGTDFAASDSLAAEEQHFIADSFSFAVEREMKESGEKAGTEDINIGVGELQECTISKSMDAASPLLAQVAINGNSGAGGDDLIPIATSDDGSVMYLKYKLEPVYVTSWSTSSGDAPDQPMEVVFYNDDMAFVVQRTEDGAMELVEVTGAPEDGTLGTEETGVQVEDRSDDGSESAVEELAVVMNADDASREATVDACFVADDCSFGVEREMKESGE